MVDTTPPALTDLVTRHFAYLLDDLGFVIAWSEAGPTAAQLVLESPDCLVRFTEHDEDWEMHLAGRDAPPDKAEWLSAGLLFNFLTQAAVNIEESMKPRPLQSLEEGLRDWSNRFRPIAGRAAAFFEPAGRAGREAAFQAFVKAQNEEARRQLAAWQAKRRARTD
jgi:hypothetical protein